MKARSERGGDCRTGEACPKGGIGRRIEENSCRKGGGKKGPSGFGR